MHKSIDLRTLSLRGLLTNLANSAFGIFMTCLVVGFILLTIGWWTHTAVKKGLQELLVNKLETILKVDVTALKLWLNTQKATVRLVADLPNVNAPVQGLSTLAKQHGSDATVPADSMPYKNLAEILDSIGSAFGYSGFLVIDSNGVNLAAKNAEDIGKRTAAVCSDFVKQAFTGEDVVSKPFRSASSEDGAKLNCTGAPVMFAAAPVYDRYGKITAILALQIRPEKDFFRILQMANPGQSGETYAFDADALMISESRFSREKQQIGHETQVEDGQTAFGVHIRTPVRYGKRGFRPVPRSQDPLTHMAEIALSGQNGVNVKGYRDYRGILVVGAWTWLPEYGFGVTTEMDFDEAFRPLRLLDSILGMLFSLVMLCVIGFAIAARTVSSQQQNMGRIGQYTVEKRIGKGEKGVVYQARHTLLRRPTALKVLLPGPSREKSIARFEREVKITSRLTHPNTVRIYDYGRTPQGVFYYAMEYLSGFNLYDLVRDFGPLPEARVIHILIQVCGSIEEAHSVGLIHRDLKPENLILCAQGNTFDLIKVVDFGSGKFVNHVSEIDHPDSGAPPGTPLYLSPEAIMSPDQMDERSDIFSIGAVAFFLLTGHDVFEAEKPAEVYRRILNDPVTPPSRRLGRPIAQDLEKLVLWCLQKNPDNRPQSASLLMAALEKCRDEGKWSKANARSWWESHGKTLIDAELTRILPMGH